MRKPKIYLDTSIINFLFVDDSPDLKKITEMFFDKIVVRGIYDIFISEVVLFEINQTSDKSKKDSLITKLNSENFDILKIDEEVELLAQKYIDAKILQEKSYNDALHVALATVNNIDFLLSWNFKHLANYNKQVLIRTENLRNGYHYPLILTNPMEILDEN
jgi:predicted nucleic acid-binding protein